MGINFNMWTRVCFRCGTKIVALEDYWVFEAEDGGRVYLHTQCAQKIVHDWCMHKLEDKKYVRKE